MKWNADAQAKGVAERVFCASMADVFEGRDDLDSARNRLWELIRKTPNLNWLLLTKRPENIAIMAPWAKAQNWPANIWLGTTVEDQERADERLPHLLKHKSSVRFLSCEPLLGSLDLSRYHQRKQLQPISWVIAGGESGAKSRPTSPDWLTGLRDFCNTCDIAFHFKQWGHWIPVEMLPNTPAAVKTQSFDMERPIQFVAMGKREAGRVLAGRTHDDLPFVKRIA